MFVMLGNLMVVIQDRHKQSPNPSQRTNPKSVVILREQNNDAAPQQSTTFRDAPARIVNA